MSKSSREQKTKNSIQLLGNDDSEKKSILPTSSKMSFDVYFRKLTTVDKKVLSHHKAPMKKYAEQKGLLEASEEEFDKVFKHY